MPVRNVGHVLLSKTLCSLGTGWESRNDHMKEQEYHWRPLVNMITLTPCGIRIDSNGKSVLFFTHRSWLWSEPFAYNHCVGAKLLYCSKELTSCMSPMSRRSYAGMGVSPIVGHILSTLAIWEYPGWVSNASTKYSANHGFLLWFWQYQSSDRRNSSGTVTPITISNFAAGGSSDFDWCPSIMTINISNQQRCLECSKQR